MTIRFVKFLLIRLFSQRRWILIPKRDFFSPLLFSPPHTSGAILIVSFCLKTRSKSLLVWRALEVYLPWSERHPVPTSQDKHILPLVISQKVALARLDQLFSVEVQLF